MAFPMPEHLSPAQALRRALALTALRWFPVGLTISTTVLLPLERGLDLASVGTLMAVQGVVVLALELPTGGLSGAIGRRPVLLIAAALAIASSILYASAHSWLMFATAMLLQGVFRALDSGPLESWYVDTVHATTPHAPVEKGLAHLNSTLGISIAVGALLGGLLIGWDPIPAWSGLATPYGVGVVVFVGYMVGVAALLREPRVRAPHGLWREAVVGTPVVICDGLRILARSRVLRWVVLVEVFWSLAMIAFETLTPVRLAEDLGSERIAAAVFGPASAAAWLLFAAGSSSAVLLRRWLGVSGAAMGARVLNGLFVALMGMTAGPIGLLVGYGLAYTAHGAAGPMHNALLHRETGARTRTVVLSINSMISGGAYSVGLLVLMPLAQTIGASTAMIIAGLLSIVGALCYLPALRQERLLRGSAAQVHSLA